MTAAESELIRVVVVDDSPTVRQALVAILHGAAGLCVVGTGATGEDAVRLAHALRPDVIALDVRMPGMDGLQATRQIMCEVPTPIVIVTGSLMQADVDITIEALHAGALTVLLTPPVTDQEACDKLVETVQLMAGVPVVHHWGMARPAVGPAPASLAAGALPAARSATVRDIAAIGIAASTGGPSVLAAILGQLPAGFPVPILVVQHICRGFVGGLAGWLAGQTPLRVGVACSGETPRAGSVLLAPEDYHLSLSLAGTILLSREPPYRGLRPSANHLFRSLADAYGPRAIGVVLTGMGDDGADGLLALRRAGGLTLAQDEASCVVNGMPGEALARGAVDRVLSPDHIAVVLKQMAAAIRRQEEAIDDGKPSHSNSGQF